ncbi:Rossmann-fold NAD(P)-binding domain-containing protein [Labilibaculum euxinus]|uniref:Oxidoreductase n=1 Tax=Labilibaculum euxinus TaxID=2686357 RepID=A0A7M4D107_9BACT|nr:oxidoreductase [Labilibaculum euxinus]MUP36336.1 oxidoreductase [Labilibaculum euxinus]MVB05541.1 oxidoreductase [Labilibaculum euxinus]
MRALVIGGSGFTGRKLIELLVKDSDYTQVCALVRSEIDLVDEKFIQIKVDFEALSSENIPECCDIAFCCFGTTIRKAQTKDNFRKVDFEYITHFAKLCEMHCIKEFHLVSAIWASPQSIFFYQKVKGELECFINSLNFETVVIYRPSVIYGNRKEFRPFEAFAAWISRNLNFLFVGKLKRIAAVTGDQLAKTIHQNSKKNILGRCIIESEEISKTQ